MQSQIANFTSRNHHFGATVDNFFDLFLQKIFLAFAEICQFLSRLDQNSSFGFRLKK